MRISWWEEGLDKDGDSCGVMWITLDRVKDPNVAQYIFCDTWARKLAQLGL